MRLVSHLIQSEEWARESAKKIASGKNKKIDTKKLIPWEKFIKFVQCYRLLKKSVEQGNGSTNKAIKKGKRLSSNFKELSLANLPVESGGIDHGGSSSGVYLPLSHRSQRH